MFSNPTSFHLQSSKLFTTSETIYSVTSLAVRLNNSENMWLDNEYACDSNLTSVILHLNKADKMTKKLMKTGPVNVYFVVSWGAVKLKQSRVESFNRNRFGQVPREVNLKRKNVKPESETNITNNMKSPMQISMSVRKTAIQLRF